MAKLEQPSTTAKTPMQSAPERDNEQPARTGVLPVVGILAVLAIAAGAFVYYQDEVESGSSVTASQATTSDNTASAPAGETPLNTEGMPAAQSAMTPPKTSTDESQTSATASAAPTHSKAAKPQRVAKTSKPARALEPRDRRVALATTPHVAYPSEALRAGEQGTVLVLAQINVDGQVTDARVIGHSGSNILDRAAPNEVRRWKFEPALHDGRPVVASIEVPVSYRLNQ